MRGLVTSPNYFAIIKVEANLPTGVAREEEFEALGEMLDNAVLDYGEAQPLEEMEAGGPIRAGALTVDKVPLLRNHSGVGPGSDSRLENMRAPPRAVDVVIHLHGYSLRNGAKLHIGRDLKARSGLDWSDPAGKDPRPGRIRPTLALLPRGPSSAAPVGEGIAFPH